MWQKIMWKKYFKKNDDKQLQDMFSKFKIEVKPKSYYFYWLLWYALILEFF